MTLVRTAHLAPVVLPMVAEPVRDGAVVIEGERITAVGPAADVVSSGTRLRRWSGVLTPGLVNAHTHLQYTTFADLATERLPFPAWLRRLVERRRDMSDAAWSESARTGAFLALRSGTTAVADVVTDPAVLVPLARSGLAGISYLEVVATDDRAWTAGQAARLAAALDCAPPGRAVGVSPHTLYTLSLGTFAAAVHAARGRGMRLHPHLAETVEEVEYVALGTGPLADAARRLGWQLELLDRGAGCTPAAQLDRIGGLGPDVHVAHGVHCDADDRALLRERATVVALCVRSNRMLGAGRPPVAAYLREGSPLALGTDSLASSPSLDLLEEARSVRELARAQGYAEADLDRRLLEAATLGGARAMGLDDIGRLAPGARADLAVFAAPADADPYAGLLDHGPGECVATVLAGRLVHRGRAAA